ncbi:MAG: patatin-like phospholipase family protein, partial [Actinomycetota bacterium]|nr:patatin-like phospholipase family protein [Actinomycetota bacterium]
MTTEESVAYASAPLECDIVMKGGITSGVVYPGAVDKLARRYRFRSIGGTSAGAIAAAVVAAAEHSPNRQGFADVATLPEELAQTPGGRPFMLQLFQPEEASRPLFSALVGFMQKGKMGGALALLRAFPRFPWLALALAVLSIVLGLVADARGAFVVLGLAAAVALVVVGVAVDVIRAVTRLAETEFGLCRLGPAVGSVGAPALTSWLHAKIQSVAGLEPSRPLTFAQLWGAADLPAEPSGADVAARRKELVRLSVEPGSRAVDLQIMTTDLTHGRPMRLPAPFQRYTPRLEDGGRLLFEPAELARFFPPDVVAHLELHAPVMAPDTAADLAPAAGLRTLLRFPAGPDLPVVVATRMSLSFPVLISAVPLWELRYRTGQPPVLRRVVFSDGGVTSNFPVHFFDSPLPTRPTFALDLTSFDEGEQPDATDPSMSVADPAAVNDPGQEPAAEIASLLDFFTALKDAAQNWRDNAQARLPGFRERTVHIRLAKGEGGLNLSMPGPKITELSERGAYAGGRLVELFSGPLGGAPQPTAHWNDSRFARYRVTMSLTERWLRTIRRGYRMATDPSPSPTPSASARASRRRTRSPARRCSASRRRRRRRTWSSSTAGTATGRRSTVRASRGRRPPCARCRRLSG